MSLWKQNKDVPSLENWQCRTRIFSKAPKALSVDGMTWNFRKRMGGKEVQGLLYKLFWVTPVQRL